MWNQFWNLFYAVVYALTAIGIAYCCIVCVTMLGDVPGPSKPMYLLLVGFGAYGSVLTGESSIMLFREIFSRNSDSSEKKSEVKPANS